MHNEKFFSHRKILLFNFNEMKNYKSATKGKKKRGMKNIESEKEKINFETIEIFILLWHSSINTIV